MSKTEEIKQLTKVKNPIRVAASTKSYQDRMLKMKKEILENAGITDSTNDTNALSTDSTVKSNKDTNALSIDSTVKSNKDTNALSTDSTVKSNKDVYFYGIGFLSIITIGILVYYKFNPQKKSVEVNTKVEEPVVYRSML